MTTFSLAYLLGAVCFFLYGLHLTEEGFRQAAGDRLRSKIGRLTRNRFNGFLLGMVMTIVFQSSTATTAMMVGLASIGLLSVRRAVAVVLGADLGTTFLVIILASLVRFDATAFSLMIVVIGFVSTIALRHSRNRFYGEAILGFGFVFFGLMMIGSSSLPLRESELFHKVISAIAGNIPVAIFFSALFTALIQSSAAVIGILLSFSAAGLLTFPEAIPFILGANIGSSGGPLLASLRAQTDGKRVAYLHLLMKLVGVAVVLPFVVQAGDTVSSWISTPSYQVAAFHIFFNVVLAVLFLPVVGPLARFSSNLAQGDEEIEAFGPKYLDKHAVDSPTMAFANVFREILRMADIAQEMCSQALVPFEESGRETMDRLEEFDDQIDLLDREIKLYLADISHPKLTDEQGKRSLELLMLTNDLESIGDVICKELMVLAQKKQRKGVSFSEEGWDEIKDFYEKVMENFGLAITSFATGDVDLGKKVIRHKKHLAELEQDLGQAHLLRLHEGYKESIETSSIHLDVLSSLRRINSIVSKLSYPVLEREEE